MATNMKVIWKYAIPIQDVFSIEMPKDSKILCVGMQKEVPCIWVEVPANQDYQKETIHRLFCILGTGTVAVELSNLEYVGTFLMMEDDLVFHLYTGR